VRHRSRLATEPSHSASGRGHEGQLRTRAQECDHPHSNGAPVPWRQLRREQEPQHREPEPGEQVGATVDPNVGLYGDRVQQEQRDERERRSARVPPAVLRDASQQQHVQRSRRQHMQSPAHRVVQPRSRGERVRRQQGEHCHRAVRACGVRVSEIVSSGSSEHSEQVGPMPVVRAANHVEVVSHPASAEARHRGDERHQREPAEGQPSGRFGSRRPRHSTRDRATEGTPTRFTAASGSHREPARAHRPLHGRAIR
jgi:hypothetical protein